MMGRGYYLQRRIDARMQQRGSPITLRRVSLLSGSNAQINPPALNNLTVTSDTAESATEISLSATVARGRFVAGDQLVMGDVTAIVASDAPSALGNGGFTNVPLTAGLSAAVAAGTPVSCIFVGDSTVYAYLNSFDNQMIDGERIQANDLDVIISAFTGGSPPPTIKDRLIILGVEKSILTVQTKINDNQQLTWRCHVR